MIKKAGVVGAGMMGAEIALCFARAGYETVLNDIKLELAENGKLKQAAVLDKNIRKGKATEEEKAKILARVTPTDRYEDLADCDIIVEAALEDLEIKRAFLQSWTLYARRRPFLPATLQVFPLRSWRPR